MQTTSLADVRARLAHYVDAVVSRHERVTITRQGKPVAVLISPEDLESLEETLYWTGASRDSDEDGPTATLDEVRDELIARLQRGRQ